MFSYVLIIFLLIPFTKYVLILCQTHACVRLFFHNWIWLFCQAGLHHQPRYTSTNHVANLRVKFSSGLSSGMFRASSSLSQFLHDEAYVYQMCCALKDWWIRIYLAARHESHKTSSVFVRIFSLLSYSSLRNLYISQV